ncbi:MAG: arsenical-resistance protein, partial [Cyanobacteriota bacterium]|nr:arsenical-resistance protein [Cyanobacteriota bacterium]
LTWGLGPLLMFSLAWLFLPDQPAFRTGLILIGIAPCIAMVLIYALLGTFYLQILPTWLGLDPQLVRFSFGEIARAVLIFLGIPLVAGFLTRLIGVRLKGPRWYEQVFLPRIGPWALYGLLFTIVVMFALQGEAITSDPAQVIKVAIPLLLYFLLMWSIAFLVGIQSGLDYSRTAALAFTAAGNNFELAIAVCISIWGVSSQQALAGVIGPLIEVPVLVSLVYLSLALRSRLRGRRDG